MKVKPRLVIAAILAFGILLIPFLIPSTPDSMEYKNGITAYPYIGGQGLQMDTRIYGAAGPYMDPPHPRWFYSKLRNQEIVDQIINNNANAAALHVGTNAAGDQFYLVKVQEADTQYTDYYALVAYKEVRFKMRLQGFHLYSFFDPSVSVLGAETEESAVRVMFPNILLETENLKSCILEEREAYPLASLQRELFPTKAAVIEFLIDFYGSSRWYRVEMAEEDKLIVSFEEDRLPANNVYYNEADLDNVYKGKFSITIEETSTGCSAAVELLWER